MKKFSYRLQKVLQVRERLKDEALRDLMICNSELYSCNEKRDELLISFMGNALQEGQVMTQAQLVLSGDYAFRLKAEIADTELQIIEAQKKVDEATATYVVASKEAKVLSTHREKKVEEYKELYYKDQETFLDELATQRAARKESE